MAPARHMQIMCTSLQTDNHSSTSPLSFYRPDALCATEPTVSMHWRPNFSEYHNKVYTITNILENESLLQFYKYRNHQADLNRHAAQTAKLKPSYSIWWHNMRVTEHRLHLVHFQHTTILWTQPCRRIVHKKHLMPNICSRPVWLQQYE